MCGIAGFIDSRASSTAAALASVAVDMAASLRHRGPDDTGTWVDERVGVGFGHTRLAVVDLSPGGAQPMVSIDGRWVFNFNGEVYNHQGLRRELEDRGVRFRGSSDTEVFLELIARDGPKSALQSVNGMFAAAVWDRSERRLWLMRDRLGEKPLYIGWFGPVFLFASELKALRRHPAFTGRVDTGALGAYLRAGYVPAPYSIYEGVTKVPAAHVLEVDPRSHASAAPTAYWDAASVAHEGLRSPLDVPEEEATDLLDAQLRESVRLRTLADVPVGAFLSGGVDSSLVTSVMQSQASEPVRTFTVGFSDRDFDEAPFARVVARHLGTSHSELYVRPEEARAVVPSLPTIYDEPFADSSAIPTYLISRLAREHVTVALSGDGGDELFAGYDRFHFHRRAGRVLGGLPPALRSALVRGLVAVRPDTWNRIGRRAAALSRTGATAWLNGDRMHKLARVLEQRDPRSTYISLVSLWQDPHDLLTRADETTTLLTRPKEWLSTEDVVDTLLWLDLVTYLPDDLLVKVDRAAMAVSLETRLPLLDPNLIRLAWRLPIRFKVRNGQSKWILKNVLERYVPRPLFDRPKKGFSVPLATWLRGPLRAWADDLLDPTTLREQGFLDPELVRDVWGQHLRGTTDASHRLWAVLMFQAWLETADADVTLGAA